MYQLRGRYVYRILCFLRVDAESPLQSHLVQLVDLNGKGKDGQTMCKIFGDMIDTVERVYGCTIVRLTTDNDGGAQAGRDLLVQERPWILADPCIAHQASRMADPVWFRELTAT